MRQGQTETPRPQPCHRLDLTRDGKDLIYGVMHNSPDSAELPGPAERCPERELPLSHACSPQGSEQGGAGGWQAMTTGHPPSLISAEPHETSLCWLRKAASGKQEQKGSSLCPWEEAMMHPAGGTGGAGL